MNPTTLSARTGALSCFLAALLLSTTATAQQAEANQDVQADEQAEVGAVHFSERPELTFELRVPSFHPTDTSFEMLSDDNQYTGTMLGVGYDLGRLALPGLRAYVLATGGGADVERFGGAVDMSWSRNLLMVGADYGPELLGFLRPSARLGAGYAVQQLEVETTGPARDDYAHDVVGMASIGLEIFTPRDMFETVRFGLLGQFGYQAQTAATFDELSADYGDDDPWDRQEASLGDLDTNGVFWDLGVGMRIAM